MPTGKKKTTRPAVEIEKEIVNDEIEGQIRRAVEKQPDQSDPDKERLHNTKLLLKQYRRVAYAVKVSEEELNLRFEMEYGTKIPRLTIHTP